MYHKKDEILFADSRFIVGFLMLCSILAIMLFNF
jgi:hypothetical protein